MGFWWAINLHTYGKRYPLV